MKVSRVSNLKQKIIPFASYFILAAINFYCLMIYYTEVTDKNLVDLGYVAYLTMLLNGLFGLTKLVNEDLFLDLRLLLDYGQLVLPHPFLTTVLWQKHTVGPNETALMHCFFGLTAFLFFAFMEYKRQDLSDLALVISIPSSIIVGALYQNYIACGAGVLMAAGYFGLKRRDECMDSPALTGYFNFVMAAYSIVTLAQFEPKEWVPKFSV